MDGTTILLSGGPAGLNRLVARNGRAHHASRALSDLYVDQSWSHRGGRC